METIEELREHVRQEVASMKRQLTDLEDRLLQEANTLNSKLVVDEVRAIGKDLTARFNSLASEVSALKSQLEDS